MWKLAKLNAIGFNHVLNPNDYGLNELPHPISLGQPRVNINKYRFGELPDPTYLGLTTC